MIIVAINLATTSLGLLLHRLNAPEYYQFGIFIGMFLLYCLLASQAWIVANKITGKCSLENGSEVAQKEGLRSPPSAKTAGKVASLK